MHKNVHVGREAFISNAFLAVKRAGHGPVMKSVVATKVGFTSQRAVDDSWMPQGDRLLVSDGVVVRGLDYPFLTKV